MYHQHLHTETTATCYELLHNRNTEQHFYCNHSATTDSAGTMQSGMSVFLLLLSFRLQLQFAVALVNLLQLLVGTVLHVNVCHIFRMPPAVGFPRPGHQKRVSYVRPPASTVAICPAQSTKTENNKLVSQASKSQSRHQRKVVTKDSVWGKVIRTPEASLLGITETRTQQ